MVICMTGDEYQVFSLFVVSVCITGGLLIGWFTMYWHMDRKIQVLQERIQVLLHYKEPGEKKNG